MEKVFNKTHKVIAVLLLLVMMFSATSQVFAAGVNTSKNAGGNFIDIIKNLITNIINKIKELLGFQIEEPEIIEEDVDEEEIVLGKKVKITKKGKLKIDNWPSPLLTPGCDSFTVPVLDANDIVTFEYDKNLIDSIDVSQGGSTNSAQIYGILTKSNVKDTTTTVTINRYHKISEDKSGKIKMRKDVAKAKLAIHPFLVFDNNTARDEGVLQFSNTSVSHEIYIWSHVDYSGDVSKRYTVELDKPLMKLYNSYGTNDSYFVCFKPLKSGTTKMTITDKATNTTRKFKVKVQR